MDYENFKESFTEALQEDLYGKGIEARFDMKSVEKLNNEGYDAVTITPADSNIGVTLNVEAFYKAHEDGATMDEVVAKASDTVIRGFDNQPAIDVASLTDYDQMKDKLIMEVVSTEANADMLANVPHKEMEDMSVVYRFVIDSNDDGRATILATNNMLEAMGVTPEQLHEDALKNAPELKPAVITGMSEVMAEMMGMSPEEMAMMGMPTDPADEQMFVATVPDKIHGAGVLAYQDFMDQAAERVGGELTALRWCDVDLEKGFVQVNHSISYYQTKGDKGAFHITEGTKTVAGNRKIPIGKDVMQAFLLEKEFQRQNHIACAAEIDGYTDFVFLNRFGNVYSQRDLNRAITGIVEKYNANPKMDDKGNEILLPQLTCHCFRHTFAVILCERNVNVKVAQMLLGHKDISTTMDIYTRVSEEFMFKEYVKKVMGE